MIKAINTELNKMTGIWTKIVKWHREGWRRHSEKKLHLYWKFFNQVILFVGTKALGTVINSVWLVSITITVQPFKSIIFICRHREILFIMIWNVYLLKNSYPFDSRSFAGLKTIVNFFIYNYVAHQFTPLSYPLESLF